MRRACRTAAVQSLKVAAQLRCYEYWGLGVGPRTQVYAQGDKLSKTLNLIGQTTVDKDAQYLTGNSGLPCYDAALLNDNDRECNLLRKNVCWYPGSKKYVVPKVTQELSDRVGKLFLKLTDAEKASIWASLIKDYPNLDKILDAPKKTTLFNLFHRVCMISDDKEATTLATPIVLEYYEKYFISWPYWWRISEKIMELFDKHPEARRFEKRVVRVSVERATKIMLNVIAEQPWALEQTTSPYAYDVCGHRACHEAGFW